MLSDSELIIPTSPDNLCAMHSYFPSPLILSVITYSISIIHLATYHLTHTFNNVSGNLIIVLIFCTYRDTVLEGQSSQSLSMLDWSVYKLLIIRCVLGWWVIAVAFWNTAASTTKLYHLCALRMEYFFFIFITGVIPDARPFFSAGESSVSVVPDVQMIS